MRRGFRCLRTLLLSTAVIALSLPVGCADRHYYRSYDDSHGDYHTWNNNETVYYQQWETQNHYDHRDFKDRDKDQQKQYYEWRHKQSNDNDKDKH